MICVGCHKTEATYVAPEKWCDDCWNDWYFNIEFLTADLPCAHEKSEIILIIVVERAHRELQDKYGELEDPPNNEIIRRAHELAAPIKFTDKEIEEEIIRQIG